MDELIKKLEVQLKSLLQKQEQLQRTQDLLIHEKKQLLEKHEGAVTQVERMINRIKSLEEKV